MTAKSRLLFSFTLSIFYLAVGFLSTNALAEDLSYLIHKANESYREGKFENAAKLYQKAINAGLNNGHVYYNLGNTFYRLNKPGMAIVSYRKALLELPRDADILANLNLARKQVQNRIAVNGQLSVNRLLILADYFSRYELTLITVFILVITCSAYIFKRVKQNSISNSLFIVSILFLFLSSSSLLFSEPGWDGRPKFVFPFSKNKTIPGVVIAPIANVHSGDSDQYQVIFILNEGVELELAEQRNDWAKVMLPTGQNGWIKSSEIGSLAN